MRRLDLHPLKKLRNPRRHLRSLVRWASDPRAVLPENDILEAWNARYWHCKIPIYDKLVSSRHTTPEIRTAVAQSLLDAAENVSKALALHRKYRVACLITPEDLFNSEVTIFFDDQYFQTFLPPTHYKVTQTARFMIATAPPTIDLLRDWGLTLPQNLVDFGGYRISELEDDEPEATHTVHNWVFAEAAFHQSDASRTKPQIFL